MEITEQYIGGLFDSIGNFYIQKNKAGKKYLYFKFNLDEKIFTPLYEILRTKYNIRINVWGKNYYITNYDGISRLIEFMKKHCKRTDYLDYLNQIKDEV